MMSQKINWYFHLFFVCYLGFFFVHFIFSCSKVKVSILQCTVILNKCQRICIYILSYLYAVTYSKWLLQICNILFLVFLFGFFLLLHLHSCYIRAFFLKTCYCFVRVEHCLIQINTTRHFLFHFLSRVILWVIGELTFYLSIHETKVSEMMVEQQSLVLTQTLTPVSSLEFT